eukprot:TRINITY_DN477_c0_g1_i1.p1 TRINITY_DN477_c0_g1~~TRINITY_DN477_c0_g1_i1.p1  ORF type:complete len:265 (-),score=29.66 TRINITY_DN477_c0_g1_i1:115-909(-)
MAYNDEYLLDHIQERLVETVNDIQNGWAINEQEFQNKTALVREAIARSTGIDCSFDRTDRSLSIRLDVPLDRSLEKLERVMVAMNVLESRTIREARGAEREEEEIELNGQYTPVDVGGPKAASTQDLEKQSRIMKRFLRTLDSKKVPYYRIKEEEEIESISNFMEVGGQERRDTPRPQQGETPSWMKFLIGIGASVGVLVAAGVGLYLLGYCAKVAQLLSRLQGSVDYFLVRLGSTLTALWRSCPSLWSRALPSTAHKMFSTEL